MKLEWKSKLLIFNYSEFVIVEIGIDDFIWSRNQLFSSIQEKGWLPVFLIKSFQVVYDLQPDAQNKLNSNIVDEKGKYFCSGMGS